MQEQLPLFLEFMQALSPHFHWIAERERCGLWMVAKRLGLWLNRVFDTAEDFGLRWALPALLSALRTLHPDALEACLHVNTSPIPRFMGVVEDAILDRGLGPTGTHQLPEDLWDVVVPPFYREGLRDFDVDREWQDGDRVVRGATRWVSQQVQRIVQALRGAGVYEETADPPPPPTCYPFVILKSSEKVSLILSCVKINKSDGANTRLLDWIPRRTWPGLYRHSRLMWASMGSRLTSKMHFGAFACPKGRARFFASGPPPGPRLWRCHACPLAGTTARICAKRVWPAFFGGCCPLRYSLCTISMTSCSSSLIGRCSGKRGDRLCAPWSRLGSS